MKNVFSRLPKKLISAVVYVLVLAGFTAGAMAGFGPDRPTIAWTNNGQGFDHVTFNSYTGVPSVGDEGGHAQDQGGITAGRRYVGEHHGRDGLYHDFERRIAGAKINRPDRSRR